MLFSWRDTIQEIFGWIGCFMNFYFYYLPIIPFINLIKGKINFEEIPNIYIAVGYANCVCWYTYGKLTFSNQMSLSYLLGSITYFILLIIYSFYEIRKYIIDTILNIGILATGTYSLYAGLTVLIDDDQVAAKFCNASSLAYFVFPVSNIYKVMMNKEYHLINVRNILISIFTSFCWTIYAVLIAEELMAYPHIINIILCLIQLYLYKIYSKKFPDIIGKDSNIITIEDKENEEKVEETKLKQDSDIHNLKERPVKIEDNIKK